MTKVGRAPFTNFGPELRGIHIRFVEETIRQDFRPMWLRGWKAARTQPSRIAQFYLFVDLDKLN